MGRNAWEWTVLVTALVVAPWGAMAQQPMTEELAVQIRYATEDFPQFQLDYVDKNGKRRAAHAVPISARYLASMAHIADSLKDGDSLSVRLLRPGLEPVLIGAAEVAKVDTLADLAWLKLKNADTPDMTPPRFCQATPNSSVLMQRRATNGHVAAALFQARGVVATFGVMPALTSDADNKLAESGSRPSNSEGAPRVVMLVQAAITGGNSGGAVLDSQRDCVVGLVSMVFLPEDLADPGQRAEVEQLRAAHPELGSTALVGIAAPIKAYLD